MNSLNLTSSILLPVSASSTASIIYSTLLCLGNVIGLLGNSLVIAATLGNQSNRFKLDRETVLFLRHLAISDVIFTILYPVPISVVYIARGWVFGKELCYIIGLMISLPATANLYFILLMSIHRYARCRFPLKMHHLTYTKARVVCGAMWTMSCVFPVYTFAAQLPVVFNANLACCSFVFLNSTGNAILIFATTVIPFILIVTVNFLLWLYVREYFTDRITTKTRKRSTAEVDVKQLDKMRASYRQGVLTTAFVTALFAVTWSPTVVRFAFTAVAGEVGLAGWAEKVRYFYFLGSWGNPVIYAMMNRGFQNYFVNFIRKLCRVCVRDNIPVSRSRSENGEVRSGDGGAEMKQEHGTNKSKPSETHSLPHRKRLPISERAKSDSTRLSCSTQHVIN